MVANKAPELEVAGMAADLSMPEFALTLRTAWSAEPTCDFVEDEDGNADNKEENPGVVQFVHEVLPLALQGLVVLCGRVGPVLLRLLQAEPQRAEKETETNDDDPEGPIIEDAEEMLHITSVAVG